MAASDLSQYLPGLHIAGALAWLLLAGLMVSKGRMPDAAVGLAVAVGFGSQVLPAVRADRRLTLAAQLVTTAALLTWAALVVLR